MHEVKAAILGDIRTLWGPAAPPFEAFPHVVILPTPAPEQGAVSVAILQLLPREGRDPPEEILTKTCTPCSDNPKQVLTKTCTPCSSRLPAT